MPTTRKRRSRTPIAPTVADLTLEEELAFSVYWHPKQPEMLRRCTRWASYDEFDAHYAALRDALPEEWFVLPEFAERRFQAKLRGEEPPATYPYD